MEIQRDIYDQILNWKNNTNYIYETVDEPEDIENMLTNALCIG